MTGIKEPNLLMKCVMITMQLSSRREYDRGEPTLLRQARQRRGASQGGTADLTVSSEKLGVT